MYTCTSCNKEQKRNPRLYGNVVVSMPVLRPMRLIPTTAPSIEDLTFDTRDLLIDIILCRKCARKRIYSIEIEGTIFRARTSNLRYGRI